MFELNPENRVGVHQVAKGVGILSPGAAAQARPGVEV